MSDKNRPRRFFLVLAALLLPAATCGVTTSLPELLRRIELVEGWNTRLEQFAANARLPRLLMDDHDVVVGTVLEYNDVMMFVSVHSPEGRPSAPTPYNAYATILFESPAGPAVVLEATNYWLATPPRESPRWVYFESGDCTGTPYTDSPTAGTPWREAWIRRSEQTLYLAPLEWTPGPERTFRSRIVRELWVSGRYFERCELSAKDTFFEAAYAAPFEPVANLSVYTPPFRIVDQRTLFGF